MIWTVVLPDLAATVRLARALAPLARARDVIALMGDLGSGKTAFARAFINARLGPTEAPSPTFNLVLTYEPEDETAPTIWHFDLYRLEEPEEALELGLEDAFAEGLSLIEWPERLRGLLPARALRLTFSHAEPGRRVAIAAAGDWADRLAPLAKTEQWT